MATDVSIKAYESFVNYIDQEGSASSRVLSVTGTAWYAQIFQAKTSSIPRLFFMAKVFSSDSNGASISDSDNLQVEVWSVTSSGSGSSQTFTLNSILSSTYTGPFDQVVDGNDSSIEEDIHWYQINLSDAPLAVTENQYYAIVFKSNISSDESNSPKVYYTENYRLNIFPQIQLSSDSGATYSNSTVPTSSSGNARVGCLCCSYIGKELDGSSSFDSGDVTVGGLYSSRRGYQTYIFVENNSSSSDLSNQISVAFSQTPPASASNGTSDETDQSMMRWYYYQEATLPFTLDTDTFKTIGNNPVLTKNASFVFFTQPDRLPAVPKAFFEESEIDIETGEMSLNPIHKAESSKTYDSTSIGDDSSRIDDFSDRYSLTYWENFSEGRKFVDDDDPSTNRNPMYLDFTLENVGSDITKVCEISIPDTTDKQNIRGFDHVVKYRDYYIAFAKYGTYNTGLAAQWVTDTPTGEVASEYQGYIASASDVEKLVRKGNQEGTAWSSIWTKINIQVDDGSGANDILGRAGTASKIIGVFDATVKKTGTSSTETLFVLLQVWSDIIAEDKPHVVFAYTTDEWSGSPPTSLTITALSSENYDFCDAEFLPRFDPNSGALSTYPPVFPRVDADYQAAKFIEPNSGNAIYFTARNARSAEHGGDSKFGLWKIDISITPDNIGTELPMVSTSAFNGTLAAFDNRGFDVNLSQEPEITFVYHYGDITYFGTSNYDSSNYRVGGDYGFANPTKMGQVYQTVDFVSFDQVLSGDFGQDWLIASTGIDYMQALLIGSSYQYAYAGIINDKVGFMTRVDDILHVWLSPSTTNPLNTPMHVAVNLATFETKVLRKFPITDLFGDSDYNDCGINGLGDVDRSKSLRTIDGGIVNGHQIHIYGKEGHGYHLVDSIGLQKTSPISFSAIAQITANVRRATVGSDYSAVAFDGLDQGNAPCYAYIQSATPTSHNGGPFRILEVTPTYIDFEVTGQTSLIGNDAGAGTMITTRDPYFFPESSIRWLIYDDRLINKAFEDYLSSTVIDDSAGIFRSSISTASHAEVKALNATADGTTRLGDAGWGVYSGKTVREFDFDTNAFIYEKYPALSPTSTNPRVGVYAGLVGSVTSYGSSFTASVNPDIISDEDDWLEYLGMYYRAGIGDGIYDYDPVLVVQGGIAYMLTNNGVYYNGANNGTGMQVFKTYGLKQLAEQWGLYTDPPTNSAYNLDLDRPIMFKASAGTRFKGICEKIQVSKVGNVTFISALKQDETGSTDGVNLTNENEPVRSIYAISTLSDLPQHFSMYYKLHSLQDSSSVAEELLDPTTSATQLTLKYAGTWEELYETDNAITIPIAQDIDAADDSPSLKNLYHRTFSTDVDYNFFRLESNALNEDESNDAYAEVLVKGLRFYDVNVTGPSGTSGTKKVAISGIVHGSEIPGIGQSIITDPANIANSSAGGAFIAPGGEIIIDFPREIYVNEITFDVDYQGSLSGTAALTEFEFGYVPRFEKQIYGLNSLSDGDWELMTSPVVFDPTSSSEVKVDRLGSFAKTIRIKSTSGVVIRVNNLKVKSLVQEGSTQFETSPTGAISSPELIVVDDLVGLINGVSSTKAAAFTQFNQGESTLEFDLGIPDDAVPGYPINRISMNIAGAQTTRTISVDVWDGITMDGGSELWENVYTNYITNFEYTFVTWEPREKIRSREVKMNILDASAAKAAGVPEAAADASSPSNFSNSFNLNQLAGKSFRPDIYNGKSVTVSASEALPDDPSWDGQVTVNTQMDSDGPFAGDVADGLGVIENNLNITFPMKQVRKIRIRILNNGDSAIRMNGLKVYTPLIDSNGDPVWPQSTVTWDIKLTAIVSG